MIFLAVKNASKKFYWLLIVVILQAVVTFVWRNGFTNSMDLLEAVLISCFLFIVLLFLVCVPLEYNRLKRQAAGLHVSDIR